MSVTRATVIHIRLLTTPWADENEIIEGQIRSQINSIDETALTEPIRIPFEEATLESVAKFWDEVAPWWIECPPDSREDGLCNICRRISFDNLLHQRPKYEKPIPLGTLQAIARKNGCPFCRLVSHTSSHTLRSTIERLSSHGSNIHCELDGDITWNTYATRIRNLCLKLTISRPDEDDETRYGWIQQILTDGEHPPEQSRNDSRLVKGQIDLQLVNCWLKTCKEHHNSISLQPKTRFNNEPFAHDMPTDIHDQSALIYQPCQSIPVGMIASDLTLIDVESECLVDLPLNTTYIALSYVWGGPQPFQNVKSRRKHLYCPHSISVDDETLPRTICDAIRLVANLGEKYVWVDSLCICQDDYESKMSQIMNMGKIYSQALITIIAASGSNANAGLPGVRAFSRNNAQRTERVQGMILANELPKLEDVIEQSSWNTRAWTFQEKELCNRCLIFCKTHIFFQCNQTVFKEDSGLRDHAIRGSLALKIRAVRQPIWNSYRRAVVKYTKRTMSDQSDAVNAFQGIASLLQPAFRGDFLFGLSETELDIALLWQPFSPIRRRVNAVSGEPLFPSWSWAGWIGKVGYQWTRHQLDDLSRVEWQCMESEGVNIRFCTSDELRAPKYGDHDHWEYKGNLRGTPYYYQHHSLDIWCLHPVAPKDKRSNYVQIQPGSQQLIFRAYTALFPISYLGPNSLGELSLEGGPALWRYSISDLDGFRVGIIDVPGQLVESLNGEHQEFVCLSRRRYDQQDDGSCTEEPEEEFKSILHQVTLYPYTVSDIYEFDPRRYNRYKPWPLYNVMMIGWDDGVASRIAIGILYITAFIQAKPIRKLITLA